MISFGQDVNHIYMMSFAQQISGLLFVRVDSREWSEA